MVAQLAKGIKPTKLRVDKVRLNLLNALRTEGKIVKKELEKTTATWTGAKPTFDILISLTGGNATLLVGPGGSKEGAEKWIFLNFGTKPHIIRAKNVPNLIFKVGGFQPKTKVKVFSSGPGASDGTFVSKKQVQHPGIEARDWTGEIVKRRKKKFTKAMIEAARI